MSWDDLTALADQVGYSHLEEMGFEVEFLRREVLYQKEAADAAKATAKFTMHNATYMMWSTIALTVSALLQALALLLPAIVKAMGLTL